MQTLERAEDALGVLVVESDALTAHARGLSTPERIAGQTWPSDELMRTNP